MTDSRTARLLALKSAAQEIANPDSALGRRARERLAKSTHLSSAGVDYALTHCLEADVARGTLSSLVRKTNPVRRAHVLLSANVFVAAFRAIAVALCQSDRVDVRPSRRDPTMTELLHAGSRGAFEIVEELAPAPGDHVWAYGADHTLQEFSKTLLPGVHLHRHGSGMGVAVFRESAALRKLEIAEAAGALAQDICAFDQRGCLSPRILLIEGSRSFAEACSDLLVEALDRQERVVPRGTLSEDEWADAKWYEATIRFVGSCARAGQGMVFLDPKRQRIMVPPVGRYLHVAVTDDAVSTLRGISGRVTTVGLFNPGHLVGLLEEAIGPRRYVDVGKMQRPVLDGPVDLRSGWRSEVL